MRTIDVPSSERVKTLTQTGEAGDDGSWWTSELQEYAAEAKLAMIQTEQELDRIWFDCFITLAKRRRGLHPTRTGEEQPPLSE
jgi:hypothetical protein